MATTSTPSTPGSRLLPLPQVPKHPSTKVRFLGCITHDPTAPASQLTLTHPPHRTRVRIDIALVADSHAPGTLCDGEWVNVIGYTPAPAPAPSGEPAAVVVVRALLLWSAGNVRLGAYEGVVFGGGDG